VLNRGREPVPELCEELALAPEVGAPAGQGRTRRWWGSLTRIIIVYYHTNTAWFPLGPMAGHHRAHPPERIR
jgi:hypothetical protein